jgi:hypothetical protein
LKSSIDILVWFRFIGVIGEKYHCVLSRRNICGGGSCDCPANIQFIKIKGLALGLLLLFGLLGCFLPVNPFKGNIYLITMENEMGNK